jgi:HlyD family secretion protein
MADKSSIFREKALERLSSPESLDQLMRIAPARDWLWLVALGFLIAIAVAWSAVGRLPTAVSGRGILIHPRRIVYSQAIATGQLQTLNVKPGDAIKKGDLIGSIDQSEIRRRLDDDRVLLRELQAQDRAKALLQQEHSGLRTAESDMELEFFAMQKESLAKSLADAQAFAPTLKLRFDSLVKLREKGLLAAVSTEMVQAEQAYLDNAEKIIDLRTRLLQIGPQEKKLETDRSALNREDLDSATARSNQIRDVQARIAVSEIELAKNTNIISEHSGRIIEVLATAGKVLEHGDRVATIAVDVSPDNVVVIAYFSVGDGKKIKPGMSVQVTPDTVERQRYGGIVGTVSAVSDLPVTREATAMVLGSAELAQGLMPNGPYIEVTCILKRDPSTLSGYQWSSSKGPDLTMSPGLTATLRATVEERAPITYVLPFLRSLSGID